MATASVSAAGSPKTRHGRTGIVSLWSGRITATILLLAGLAFLVGGGQLILLGGSPYYLLAGMALVVTAVLLFRRTALAAWAYLATVIGTALWAFWEVGAGFWPLVPRIVAPLVLAIPVALIAPHLRQTAKLPIGHRTGRLVAAGSALILVAMVVIGVLPHPLVPGAATSPPMRGLDGSSRTLPEWTSFGNTVSGTRFARIDQLTPANVAQLKPAWTFRMGPLPERNGFQRGEEQATPLQVGDTVYVCNAVNVVFALQADTGRLKWKFDPKANSPIMPRCRGLAYKASTLAASLSQARHCDRRIYTNTVDARLIALDAGDGKPCYDFGSHGTVDLKEGIGEAKPGFFQQNSAPTLAGRNLIVGAWVIDNEDVDMPSGVIRAYDAITGALSWAWDMGRPNEAGPPPKGQTYTRSTPNMWGHPAVDEKLGLVYIPTGNGSPDFYGAHRSRVVDEHSSSVVALDLNTGRERWRFRTVLHDVWDYDVSAQPMLFDVPDGKGGTVPALAELTKRGEIFLLDRRNGQPIAKVVQKSAPTGGGLPGERLSATQPYSVGMPSVGTERLTESSMWGATPLDQLWCRINFRKMRYEGEFTPVSTSENLIYPGFIGGFNWGGGSFDERNRIMVVTDIRLGLRQRMVPRPEATEIIRRGGREMGSHISFRPNYRVPWAVEQKIFLSPLGVPCNAPPWGTITGIDMLTRKIAWQIPAGTIEDTGPFGLRSGAPVPIGMPTLGGPLTTSGGLTFYAGTRDYHLRAYDTRTGVELWKHRLPVGAQASPISYVSPRSGRQYVAIVAGGARYSTEFGDYVIAFSIPPR